MVDENLVSNTDKGMPYFSEDYQNFLMPMSKKNPKEQLFNSIHGRTILLNSYFTLIIVNIFKKTLISI